ncbi:hypothetical protein ACOMCU_00470 [Lysinibacillus sp. UGB7]|uniref:hypothetical protein n=1 Tax=Lysinibacillus sp. UGB7 TaxID=3411039 RepID=UPI003B7ACC12
MEKKEISIIEAFDEVLTKALAKNPDLINILEQRLIEKRKRVEERKKLRNKHNEKS